jgi:hypothetical protein
MPLDLFCHIGLPWRLHTLMAPDPSRSIYIRCTDGSSTPRQTCNSLFRFRIGSTEVLSPCIHPNIGTRSISSSRSNPLYNLFVFHSTLQSESSQPPNQLMIAHLKFTRGQYWPNRRLLFVCGIFHSRKRRMTPWPTSTFSHEKAVPDSRRLHTPPSWT